MARTKNGERTQIHSPEDPRHPSVGLVPERLPEVHYREGKTRKGLDAGPLTQSHESRHTPSMVCQYAKNVRRQGDNAAAVEGHLLLRQGRRNHSPR